MNSGLPSRVLDRHLALAVGPQIGDHTALAHFAQAVHQTVRERDGHGHELGGIPASVTEHHPLIAGALAVQGILVAGIDPAFERRAHSLGDVRRLLVESGDDAAGGCVEAVLGPSVADALDSLADERGHVDVSCGGDLAGDDHQTGGYQRLAGDVTMRVVPQDRVEHGVRDLVGDLVGMPFAHRLRREQEFMILHRF